MSGIIKEVIIDGKKRYVGELERDVYLPTQLVINLELSDDHKPTANCRFGVKKAPIAEDGIRYDLAVVDPKLQKISIDLSDVPQGIMDYFNPKILGGFDKIVNPPVVNEIL
jgi:hypothetical protein